MTHAQRPRVDLAAGEPDGAGVGVEDGRAGHPPSASASLAVTSACSVVVQDPDEVRAASELWLCAEERDADGKHVHPGARRRSEAAVRVCDHDDPIGLRRPPPAKRGSAVSARRRRSDRRTVIVRLLDDLEGARSARAASLEADRLPAPPAHSSSSAAISSVSAAAKARGGIGGHARLGHGLGLGGRSITTGFPAARYSYSFSGGSIEHLPQVRDDAGVEAGDQLGVGTTAEQVRTLAGRRPATAGHHRCTAGEEGGVEALLDHAHVADQRPRQPGELFSSPHGPTALNRASATPGPSAGWG